MMFEAPCSPPRTQAAACVEPHQVEGEAGVMTVTDWEAYAAPMAHHEQRHGRPALAWRMTIPGASEALTPRGRYAAVLTAAGVELSFCWPFSPHLREALGVFGSEAEAQAFAALHWGAR